jgi:NADP-dependent 3-hydroxy acid dehydrogenase YdfG
MISVSKSLHGQVAVVTGASRGIGRAFAMELNRHGATVCAVGRDRGTLQKLPLDPSRVHHAQVDLTSDEDVQRLASVVERDLGGADILVCCAGEYHPGGVRTSSVAELDSLYRANVHAPFVLIQSFLPMLLARRGQIVVVGSTQSLSSVSKVGPFAATQHALSTIVDSLRQEVNDEGVRVLKIIPGRTATPRIERLFQAENRPYDAHKLLQPEDIASVAVHALTLPRTAEVTSVSIRPMKKSY